MIHVLHEASPLRPGLCWGDFDHGFVPSKGGKILRVQSGRGAERMPKLFENEWNWW